MPLNVSRSFLQNDGFVKKISDYITKKVADKLNGLFKTSREDYEKFWDDISPFIKFGSLKDEKFFDKMKDSILFQTTKKEYQTVQEYLETYKDIIENQVYYATDELQQAQYIKLLQDHDLEAVVLSHSIDQPFISHMEQKHEGVNFTRVDSDLSELMKEIDEHHDEEVHNKLVDSVKNLFYLLLIKKHLILSLSHLRARCFCYDYSFREQS